MAEFRGYVFILIAINIGMFVMQSVFPWITSEFVLVSSDVLSRPWILVTSMFLHGDALHLIFNMLALALFGIFLEKFIGSEKFLMAYFLTGIVAGVGSTFFYASVLGASGAIFGVQGYLAAIRPKLMMWVFGVPMPMFVAVILWSAFNFAGLFFPAGIAFASHLFGLFFGIILGLYLHGKPKIEKKEKNDYPSEEELDAWEDIYMRQG